MTSSIGSQSATRTDAPRGHRGRILVVGDPASMPGLDEACDRSFVHVSNLFDAVGELCTARPHEPIKAVLIAQSLAGTSTTRAIQSLRRFDPAVQLVLVCAGEGGSVDPTVFEQFDHYLDAPLTGGMIQSVLGDTRGSASSGSESDDSDDSDFDFAAESIGEIEIERQQTVSGRQPPDSSAGQPAAPVVEASVKPPGQVNESDEPLGDIDLVDAVMHDPAGVRDRCVALIAQQTGWSGVELREEAMTSGIAVVNGGIYYGTLVAEAPREAVEPWAEWLGYWMALDASYRTNRTLSLTDELTGAWNRRYFESFLNDCIHRAARRRRPVTVMVLDLDDFKVYNDTYGHSAGDEILRETVRLLTSVIRRGDRVCRIGGDEFAVIFADIEGPREPGSEHPHSVEQVAKRFQDEICRMHFPKLGIEAPGTLSVSAGLATYPWDGHEAQSLLEHADQLALESKRRGKNAITMGPGAQETCGKH